MGKIVLWAVLGVLGLFMVGGVLSVTGNIFKTATVAATAPGKVIQQTLQTDNIIHKYEWFHDTNAAYTAKLGQIRTHKDLLGTASSSGETSRLNIELAAMKQACRDLVTRYNANSTKTNVEIFRGREAPESLVIETCE